ncbi:hypothetical protein M430DRAFT_19343 [Amorphotheca resinae ATCC 22711]|jgi:hypothetical protein|uniref:Uncharacterized protein n=1 Tax=Amorphotheca resinae ATCC 22711 TaxID=857342 RepID=A0A2T3B2H1_AMORE|nr:hypothetical protein M430DRAFT_19343 [Amorphotheca resinae ATCC 22711]PSS18747.1 hypothetical protein M430DRAFT_19343 [Amorphotheca resinae ATCC 22711]
MFPFAIEKHHLITWAFVSIAGVTQSLSGSSMAALHWTSTGSSKVWRNPHFGTALLKILVIFTSRSAAKTNLAPDLQPLFLSRLPPELRSYIWGYVASTTAYSVFMLVVAKLHNLLVIFATLPIGF